MCQREPQREAPEIRKLVLNGVHGVGSYDLGRSIATTASQCKTLLLFAFCAVSKSPTFVDKHYLDRDEFRRDVLRVLVFYWKRGYREAQLDTAVTRIGEGRVRVVFDIKEGPPTLIGRLRVDYDSTLFNQRRIQKLALLRAGHPLNLVVLDTMRLGYQLELWERGYADAQVDTIIAVDARQRVADVTVKLTPNWPTKVGQITVRGNNQVDAHTIGNSIMLQTGKPFRYTDLAESQRNLYESNLFRLAVFSVPPKPDSIKNVDIEVRETQMKEARTAGGFNNIDFLQMDGRFTNYNTFGGARRLDLTGIIGNLGATHLSGRFPFREAQRDFLNNAAFTSPTWQVSGDVRQPAWLRKPENALSLGGFAHRRAAPAVYIDRGYGGQVAFTRTLAPRASASSAYRFEVTRVEAGDVYFCVNYGVCDLQTIAALRARQRIAPLTLTANLNRQNDPLEPSRGYTAQLRLEHASAYTGSSFRYNSVYLEGAAYRPVGARSVLAAHTRVGFVRALASTAIATGAGEVTGDILHPRTRLYAGGARSVRGVGENQLGPRVLTLPQCKLAAIGCDTTTVAVANCNLSGTDTAGSTLKDRDFTPRPLGGRALIEGSVEFRFPIWRQLFGATFVDGALLGQGSLQSATKGAGAITPGVGVRYISPVGPIRVDLGLNPTLPEDLPVITQVRDTDGQYRIVQLKDQWRYNPTKGAAGITGVLRRLTLRLSIGEAY